MKVYKITLLVIDHEGHGEDQMSDALDLVQHFYHRVMKVESREIEFTDDHPLNKTATVDAEFWRIFG